MIPGAAWRQRRVVAFYGVLGVALHDVVVRGFTPWNLSALMVLLGGAGAGTLLRILGEKIGPGA